MSWKNLPVICFVCAGSAALGLLITADPRLIAAPFVPVVLYGLLASPVVRIGFIAIGGVLTLQGADGLTPPKVLYLLGVLACVGFAGVAFLQEGLALRQRLLRPIMQWAWLWGLLVLGSLYVAASKNISAIDWFRGAVPYLLFASVPLAIYDLTKARPTEKLLRIVLRIFVVAGLLTAISWFVAWTARRGYADLGADRLFLWSFVLPAALLCYAVSAAYHAHRDRLKWFFVAALILTLFALTGTRQTVLFVIAPIVIMLSGSGASIKKTSRFAIVLVPALLVGALLVATLTQTLGLDLSQVQERLLSIRDITNQEQEGRSYQERLLQTELAREAFANNIWTGVSPGHRYEWFPITGGSKSSLSLDSPLAFPASFGLLGILVVIATLWTLKAFLSTAWATGSTNAIEIDAIRAFTIMMLVYVLAGSPFEDKGLSFAFMFLLSLTVLRHNLVVDRERSAPPFGSHS